MTKIVPLNLDDLATPTKSIILDKVRHDMRELTVQEFIDRTREAQKIQAEAGPETADDPEAWPMDKKIEKLVDMIHDAFPTITKERLSRLHFNQLNAVLDLTLKTPDQITSDIAADKGASEGNA